MDFGDLQELQAAYRHEAADLLSDLGDALLLLEQDSRNMEVVNRIFRAMHTLKGSGASAGFRRLAGFVHHVEDVFNRVRSGQLQTTPELIDATLKACDCCVLLLQLGSTAADTLLPLEIEVMNAIRPFLPEVKEGAAHAPEAGREGTERTRYKIFFRPHREIFFSGTDPASILLELSDLGTLVVTSDTSELFGADSFDPEQSYLSWTMSLDTIRPLAVLKEVFRFVEDDCEVHIEVDRVTAAAPDQATRYRQATEQCFSALGVALELCRSGEEKQGLSTASRAAKTLFAASKAHQNTAAMQAATAVLQSITSVQDGSVLDDGLLERLDSLIQAARAAVAETGQNTGVLPPVQEPENGPSSATEAPAQVLQSIRVESSKLDALMRLAGELLVVRGALPAFAERLDGTESTIAMAKEMRDAGAKVSRLADDLQATVMSIRMLPVRQVFQKFPRLVRDIARHLDKSIELRVSGEETELDKTVIESIGDPLTHIIRNAADHGIESKADRLAKGKPECGRIELAAFTRGATVVIEIKDDGKGLDPARLKQRALERGLFSASALAAMDEQSVFKIILCAGFSTVDVVTDLSGRGVGMDVVRMAVEALRGVVHISSKPGCGTCFRIELPASLLVSKGILVAVNGQKLMLPMETIRSMVKLPASAIRTVQGKQFASVRGAVFPMMFLANSLLTMQEKGEGREDLSIAVIEAGAGSYGLIVDRFLGEVEVVIKPLTGVLAQLQEYVGAAIMGDGRTVLVVNTERLLSL